METLHHVPIGTAMADLHRFGSLNGAFLLKGSEIISNHFPVSESRVQTLALRINEMYQGYDSVQRNIKEFIFGYDRGHVLIFNESQFRLILFADLETNELDALANAARQFLVDHFVLLSESTEHRTDSQPVPIAPVNPIQAGTMALPVDGVLAEPVARQMDPATPAANEPIPIIPAPSPPMDATALPEEEVKEEEEEEECDSATWLSFRDRLHRTFTKVIGAAQASRMIDRQLNQRGYSDVSAPPAREFSAIANSLVEKVPHKARRQSIQQQVDEMLSN